MSKKPPYSIADLKPDRAEWPVKVWVTSKSKKREYLYNGIPGGTRFSMILMDDFGGEIRAVAFDWEVSAFYYMFKVNEPYYIWNAHVQIQDKKYRYVENDYEMILDKNTQMQCCPYKASDIPFFVRFVQFDFMPIRELENLPVGSYMDVIGIVTDWEREVNYIDYCQSTGELNLPMRRVDLVDSSGSEITLALWKKQAEEFNPSSQTVVALKRAKLTHYGGGSLSTMDDTILQINPDIPAARMLRAWYRSSRYNFSF